MKFSLHLLLIFLFGCGMTVFAQNEREKGFDLYQKGDCKTAIELLKSAVKSNANDSQSWLLLGLCQVKADKLKDAEKSLKKSYSIDEKNVATNSSLAFVYLLRNQNDKAKEFADAALELDKNSEDSQYVLGVVAFRNGFFNRSYEHAKNILAKNPSNANAHLLKVESLVSSFIQQSGTILPTPNSRSLLLKEAESALESYLKLKQESKDVSFYKEYLDSIKFFAGYYEKLDVPLPASMDSSASNDSKRIALRIREKPRAEYTDQARKAGVSGTIRLMVNFSNDGKVKNILVVKALGFGLDQEAVLAVKGITFEPETKDGKPIAVVKFVEYSFKLY